MLQLFCVSQQAKQASPKIQHLSFVFVFFKDALLQIKSLTERELHTVEQTPKANYHKLTCC